MSRTFRNTNIKPSMDKSFYQSGDDCISVYLNGLRRGYRSIYHYDIDREFYHLYRDKRRCSYRYYRKYEEQQFKTYCKRFIRQSLMDGEDGALKPVKRACRGYWD